MDLQLQPIQYVGIGLAAVLILGLRLWRTRRPRRLRLETLWVSPALLWVIAATALYEYPPVTPHGWLWPPLATLVGAAPGWYWGTHRRIGIDPATHRLNQQETPTAILFFLLVLAARQAFRFEARRLGVDLMDLGCWLLCFYAGFLTATRIETFLRARRLLVARRG